MLKSGQRAKSASALLLTGLILFLSLLSASPALHKLIHADSDTATHSCVITLFAKGHVNAAAIAPILAGLAVLFGGISLLSETSYFTFADHRFSSSRAPPASASLLG